METSCGVVLVNFGTVLLLQYPQGHWDLPKVTLRRMMPTESGQCFVNSLRKREFRKFRC